MPTIAILTDFGARDWYVSSLKAVILGIAPGSGIVDITHEIPPGNTTAGAFALLCSYRVFTPGTVFVAVVDPGVGGGRKPIAARCGANLLVGPDNGLLAPVLDREDSTDVREVTNRALMREPVSATFHGRDIFAPVAAHLSAGTPFEQVGPPARQFRRGELHRARLQGSELIGQIVYIDRFGNAMANITATDLAGMPRGPLSVRVGSAPPLGLREYYAQVEPGLPLALIGSEGFLEVSVNLGNAAGALGIAIGDKVVVSG